MVFKIEKDSFPLLINLGKLWLEKTISRLILISIILIIAQVGIVIFFYPQLPPQVPLFYSRPWGKDQLAPFQYLFLLPTLSLFFLLLNTVLAIILLEKKRFLSICLVVTGTIFTLFSLISLIKIIFVVI